MNDKPNLLSMTAAIVASYVGTNSVRPAEIPALIAAVHASLAGIGRPKQAGDRAPPLKPAVPIALSITPDYLICLDDGKRFKVLQRHLGHLGMTPAEYRAKWGLPVDYPMVAPGYAAARSKPAIASEVGHDRTVSTEADGLMAGTALSPVKPDPATLAPVVGAMQPEPMDAVLDDAEAEAPPPARRRARLKVV